MRLKKGNKGVQTVRMESEAHIEFESVYEQEQAAHANRVKVVSMMLNLAYKENGEDGLRNNGWVDAVVNAAKKSGVINASEEMLIERFRNEGHINLERDMQRLEQREGAVAINQTLSTGGAATGIGFHTTSGHANEPTTSDYMEEHGFNVTEPLVEVNA